MGNYSVLSSRTFWIAVLLASYNTAAAFQVFYAAPWLSDIVNIVGVILVTYFHVNPSQQYNPPPQQ